MTSDLGLNILIIGVSCECPRGWAKKSGEDAVNPYAFDFECEKCDVDLVSFTNDASV